MLERRSLWLAVAWSALMAGGQLSCIDPVHSDDVAALGDEKAGVPTGPTHRPGQPCRVCHGGMGPGKPEFIVAGTVYQTRGVNLPAPGTTVNLYADEARTNLLRSTRTNEVGNFYISTDDWKPGPTFPIFASLINGKTGMDMVTGIGRDGGCAFCHYGADGQKSHMPPLFLQ